ncbi:MAG: hypothetical protein WBB85_00210 [Albidovulum sp.]|uniref:hypothetical protein n=1 Tax=Albidovulum sp. TaxID=1872424 RepID=UPI003CAEAB1F
MNDWLVGRDKPVIAALALRAALRSLPFVIDIFQSTQYQDRKGRLFLSAFRSSLKIALAAKTNDDEYWRAAESSGRKADHETDPSYPTARSGNALYGWISVAFHTTYDNHAENSIYVPAATFREETTHSEQHEAERAYWLAVSEDASAIEGLLSPSELFERKLWLTIEQPAIASDAWDTFVSVLENEAPTWRFWIEWVQSFRSGYPVDWDLQREVAAIPDEDWESGPEHIARIVAEISARHALHDRIRELENELARSSTSRLGIGGNNPPEPLSRETTVARELLIVWEPLQQLKQEARTNKPSRGKIERLIGILGSVLQNGISWCGTKADLAVDTTIKWAIPAGGGYFALNPSKLEAVIEAAKKWLAEVIWF